MFPVNSIIDKALTSIRASVEDHVYSTLATHLKDYEGPAEDYSDRYGEITCDQNLYGNDITNVMSTFPKRPDVWIIAAGYTTRREYTTSTYVYLTDNYGYVYTSACSHSGSFPIVYGNKVKSESDLILEPRLNNKLIDLIKKASNTTNYGSMGPDSLGNHRNETGTLQAVLATASACKEIAAYHHRLYGIINGLKKENAALKAKLEKPAPDYMDDLLGFKTREPI
jgi:hypothetical protein